MINLVGVNVAHNQYMFKTIKKRGKVTTEQCVYHKPNGQWKAKEWENSTHTRTHNQLWIALIRFLSCLALSYDRSNYEIQIRFGFFVLVVVVSFSFWAFIEIRSFHQIILIMIEWVTDRPKPTKKIYILNDVMIWFNQVIWKSIIAYF